jgi:hypothetical protein
MWSAPLSCQYGAGGVSRYDNEGDPMNSKIIALAVAFALVCTTQSLASWRDVVDMAFETVWMIGQEAQYTCGGSGARMNVWMAEEMMEADGLTAIDTTSPAWPKGGRDLDRQDAQRNQR